MIIVENENGIEVEIIHSTFPAGEVYVRIADISLITPHMIVRLHSADSDSIMRAIMIANALDEAEADDIVLVSDYLPYSRQDRVCKDGESSSLETLLCILLPFFDEIITLDVHNKDSIKGYSVINQAVDYDKYIQYTEGLVIVSPDKGAQERCQLAAQGKVPAATLIKTRGISDIVQEPNSLEDIELIKTAERLLIVDDICDGGATFLSAAKVLRGLNSTAELHLLVTHGIFSQGFDKLNEIFASVRCVNPYYIQKEVKC